MSPVSKRAGFAAVVSLGILALLGWAAPAFAEGPQGDPYTLDTCIVSGKKLGSAGDPVIYVHEGRELRFCTKECVGKFQSDAKGYLKKLDAAIVAQQGPYYPMKSCPVSGEALAEGDMGAPVDYVWKNRLVRFCCGGCIKKFEADPAKYLALLDKAVIDAQSAAYPLTTCVITGETLGEDGKPVDMVIANRLIRVCCNGCIKKVRKNPAAALAKVDAGKAPSSGAGENKDDASHGH